MADMAEGNESSRWGEVLMLSVALTGHITPLLYVANRLVDRGVSVTLLITEDERALVEKKVDRKCLEAGGLMNFRLVKSASKLEAKDSGAAGLSTNLERACEPLLQKLVAEQESGLVPVPKCIVADQFLGWTQVWADKLGIPRYVSFPSPAIYAVAMLCHTSLEDQVDHASDKDDVQIPRLSMQFRKSDLPGSFIHDGSFRTKVVDRSGDSFREAAGILFNTFYELESHAIDSFQANVEETNAPGKVPKMLPIGPMLPTEFFKDGVLEDETAKNSECIQWLDSRPASSVLYIAFGSLAYLSPHQIQALALALEATQVPFLWILRVDDSPRNAQTVSELLPPGFGARTQDQGFIYSEFAPQLQILSHPSTGGFLTHCGWNSSLESICRGVPMIGWPNKAEQGLCCRVLVDLAKVAVEVTKGPHELASRRDLETAMAALMKEPRGQELKRRAAELQQAARAAVAPGGSSHRNFEQLVKDIRGQT